MAEETKTDVAATEEPAKDAKKARSGKKKWPIVVGVVAVVLVAAGAGFFVWHEQPSFCNAICHTPMDAYAESYIDGSHDKYGNELTEESDKMAMMAYYHGHTTEGETTNCLGCHVPTLGEQITEGMHWVTGSYEVAGENKVGQTILEERELADLVEARGIEEDEFCLNGDCHHVTDDGKEITSRADLEAATADLDSTYNPHLAQHGEYACSQCHKAHSQSVNYCTQCHSSAPVPEGWLTTAEAKKLSTLYARKSMRACALIGARRPAWRRVQPMKAYCV